MKIKYQVEQRQPVRKKTVNKTEEERYAEFFWGTLGAVRRGEYNIKDFNSLADQVEEERKRIL